MGLSEIVDITQTQVPNAQGQLVRTFTVTFTTEETSGSFDIEIPADEFSPEVARQQAEQEAQEIDSAFTADESE